MKLTAGRSGGRERAKRAVSGTGEVSWRDTLLLRGWARAPNSAHAQPSAGKTWAAVREGGRRRLARVGAFASGALERRLFRPSACALLDARTRAGPAGGRGPSAVGARGCDFPRQPAQLDLF